MGQSGPLWSLYPLLAIIALCEFSCGIVHLLFCLPLYFLCLPLLNGVLGLVASFHAIFLRYPNRCDFYLQFVCSVMSFFFFFSSLMETYCVGDFNGSFECCLEMNANIKEGICYGLKYRTLSTAESCADFLGPIQMSFLSKIGWEAKNPTLFLSLPTCNWNTGNTHGNLSLQVLLYFLLSRITACNRCLFYNSRCGIMAV
ncbi:hypothetical protein ANCCAN_23292 [Ancylostoma caninum]|uniref:Uncharacterized protein n=1 Tax=Ancylostoma caninum TaxID=29170 RepID=A0A368FFF0_ANCCA|nr:hypothetical protein ANCCAN_23292 [Ancylostoma caninum]